MWRRVVSEVAADYPDVELRHGLADSVAMQIVTDPETFDVLVMENTFGDILSDVAAAVTGGLGLAASASLGDAGPGIFEPVHGSAPDIAGTGAANPTAMLRSLALCSSTASASPRSRAPSRPRSRRRSSGADARPRRHGDDVRVRRRRARRSGGRTSATWCATHEAPPGVGYPGPDRQPQRRRRGAARARRDRDRAARELHRGRRGDGRRRGVARRAADRELPARAGRRDARPALRGAALDRLRGDAADRSLRRREGRRSSSRRCARCAPTRSRSTSAAT